MKATGIFIIGLIILAAFSCGAHGEERKFEKYNFAVTPPDGWAARTDVPGFEGATVLAAFAKPDNTESLIIAIDDGGDDVEYTNEDSMAAFKRGIEKSGGGKPLSEKYIVMGGP